MVLRDRLPHPDMWFSRPTGEDPSRIVELLEPKGKDVLSVAGYGYPLLLAGHGAGFVFGIDANPLQIAYNEFQAALVRTFLPEELGYILADGRSDELSIVAREEAELDREMAERTVHALRERFRTSWDAAAFGYLLDPSVHRRAREAINDERVVFEHVELLDALAGYENYSFDGFYISSVRNWTLAYGFSASKDAIAAHERLLSEELERTGTSGFSVLESRVEPIELFKVGGLGDLPGMRTVRTESPHYLMRPR